MRLMAISAALSIILTLWSVIVVPKLDLTTPASNMKLWIIYLFLDASYGYFFYMILLKPIRWIASKLPGSNMPSLTDEKNLSEQEGQCNDATIVWPTDAMIDNLPRKWIVEGRILLANETSMPDDIADDSKSQRHSSSRKRRISTKEKSNQERQSKSNDCNSSEMTYHHQPYYLNHVRGSTRIRQASQRLALALGTLTSSYILCNLSSQITLKNIGLGISSPRQVLFDVSCGFGIGSFIVLFIFLLEIQMGWIKVVGYWETVVPDENFAFNITWDILFHVGVSINEEIMLRGWMFLLGCRGFTLISLEWFDDPYTSAAFAVIVSTILQSTLFAFLHIYSPGSTMISLLNLFIGGIAATMNVLVGGGSIWLGIGWHFGWNIFMGHILGRSTSGIPMSCAVVSIIPQPALSEYHGGTFGPEQGILAPLAYVLGMVMIIQIYGWEDFGLWIERIIVDSSNIIGVTC